MSVRLTLLCHGRITSSGSVAFPVDEPVDPRQLSRVPALRDRLGRLERLWSGPEARTRGTAASFGLPVEVEPELRDGDFGRWRGATLDEIGLKDPYGVAAWLTDPAAAPHGGESIADVIGRVGAWLDRYDAPGHTLAVTHPTVIRAALLHCLDAPATAFWRLDIEHLSVTDLRRRGARWTIRSMGDAAQ